MRLLNLRSSSVSLWPGCDIFCEKGTARKIRSKSRRFSFWIFHITKSSHPGRGKSILQLHSFNIFMGKYEESLSVCSWAISLSTVTGLYWCEIIQEALS